MGRLKLKRPGPFGEVSTTGLSSAARRMRMRPLELIERSASAALSQGIAQIK